MKAVAEMLDKAYGTSDYTETLSLFSQGIEDMATLPSARILSEMQNTGESYFDFVKKYATSHETYFNGLIAKKDFLDNFKKMADESIQAKKEMENSDSHSFPEFLKDYLAV
jgi:glutamate--cysteine ligase